MAEHVGLPVPGYKAQSDAAVAQVTANKHSEERLLRLLDDLAIAGAADKRWLAIARTGFEEAFMALNRAIFKPGRVALPEDVPTGPDAGPTS